MWSEVEETYSKPVGVCSFLGQARVGQWVVGGTPRAATEGPPRGSQAEQMTLMKQVRLRDVQVGSDWSSSRIGCLYSARTGPSALQTGRQDAGLVPPGPLPQSLAITHHAHQSSRGSQPGRATLRLTHSRVLAPPTQRPASPQSPLAFGPCAPRSHQSSFALTYKGWRDSSWPKSFSAAETSLLP